MTRRTVPWHAMLAVPAFALALLALPACGGSDSSTSTPATSTSGAAAATAAAAQLGEPSREIEVAMRDNFFEPKEIRVKAGETVKITAPNEGIAIHNMIVEAKEAEGRDFQSSPLVNPGDTAEIVMMISKPGTYRFYCAFHLPDMVGSVIVE